MKNILFRYFFFISFFSFFISSNNIYGSHSMGVDFYYTCLGGNTYEFTLAFYRDCAGVSAPNSINISISSSCASNTSISLAQQGPPVELTNFCIGNPNSTCNGGSDPGVEQYIYSATYTLPANCPDWTFSFTECCRNALITNLQNPDNEDMYIEATLNNATGACNSSPQFTELPVPFLCDGQPFCYNHGAIDSDGDSIVYSLTNPLTGGGSNISHISGYSSTYPIITNSGTVNFDPFTGQMCFTPNGEQVCVVTVLVEEYRNGVLIGTTMRDLQVIVMDCTNDPPPVLVSVPCGASYITLDILDPILCSSIASDGSDFLLTGPGGPFNITSAVGQGCGTSTSQIFIYVSPNIIMNSNYTLTITTGIDGNTLTNPCGQEIPDPTTLTFVAQPVPATIYGDDEICAGKTVILTASSGTSWLWNTGATTQNISVSPSVTTSYSVTVTNDTCTSSASFTITVLDAPDASFTATPNPACVGQPVSFTDASSRCCTGFGCIIPAIYMWDFGDGGFSLPTTTPSSPTHTYNSPGTYTVTYTVTDPACGCDNTMSMVITVSNCSPCSLVTGTSSVNVLCNGYCDGSASATPTGGTAPYSYQWDSNSGNQTTQTATGLCAGTYNVTITDGGNCTDTITFTITEPSLLGITTNANPVSCNGASDGTASASPSGGASPYQYNWSNGQLTSTASGLTAGSYTITITDNNSCSNTAVVTITEPAGMSPSISSTDENCGSNDGTASVNLSGGTAPFTYLWSDGQTSSTAIALAAGIYTVTITDSSGCTEVSGIVINSIGGPTLSITANNISCFGAADGSASVTGSGANPPYTYLWDDTLAQTNSVAIGLVAGTYNVSVTDNSGCTQIVSMSINEPSPLTSSLINLTDVSCNGFCDGQIELNGIGGLTPYTYSWSNSSSSSSNTGLCAGNYSVTIIDSNGCDTTQSFSINQPSMLLATGTTIASKCGNNDGSATINPSGGISPYTYLWNDPNAQSTQTADSLIAQTYNVTISDANGCSFVLPVTIGFVNGPEIDTITSTDVNCFGDSDGSASVAIINGTPPFVYTWNDGSTTSTISGLMAGTYVVTITDLYSCDTVGSITITEPTELFVNVMGTDTMCYGETGGVLNAITSGGTPQYTYIWNNFATTSTIIVSPANTTTYTVSIIDSNNCQSQDSSSIFVSPAIVASVTNEVICEGENVLISVSASFGNGGPYNYLWNEGSTTSAITVSPLSNTNYQVTVSDGCSMSAIESLVVNVSPIPEALFSVSCFPDPYVSQFNDESIIANGTIASWFWDFDDGEISTKQHPIHEYSIATTYNVNLTITSADGCVDTYSLLVQSPPIASFTPYPHEATTANPIIEFTDASLNNITTWSWNFGDGSSTTTTIPIFDAGGTVPHTYDSAGIYKITLMVTDINGCLDTTSEYVQIIEEYILFAPNTFTPNGNGLNEEFMPVGIGFAMDNFEMLIYNRWGDLIFKTKDYKKPWDGKANNGTREAQAGVYVWMIKSTDPKKKKHKYIGHVTLVK